MVVAAQTRSTDRPGVAYLTPELVILMRTATREINQHTNDGGQCTACGAAWPCERALLAEHNLAAL